MEVELLNCFKVDLKWNSVTKGRRSMTRRPRKPWTEGFESGSAFETNKIVDASLKKRKLLQQSSPVPQTLCLHGLPAGPQTPSVHHEDPSQRYNSISQSQKTKSKTRLRNKGISKYEDFSGIELLAAAACSSLINESADHVNDVKVSKEHMEAGGSLNRDTLVPDSRNLHDDGNQKAAAAKGLRLHWDLNTVMDEWEEPCDDLLVAVPLIESCNGDSFMKTCQDLGTNTIISSKTSDCESCVSKSDVVDSLIHPDKCEDFSTSTTSVLQEETVVKGESLSKSDEEPVSEEATMCKSYCDDQEEPPSEECCGSNVTQDEQCGDVDKIQEAGYDSPFEDGELREANDDESENPSSEKVNHGQSSLLVKDASIVEQVTLDIPHSQHGVEESDYCGSGKDSSARKNVHIDESVCRNVPQSRSSNTVRAYEHYRPTNISSRNYTPSGGYRAHNNNNRRPSSERYNVYGGDIHRAPNRYRFHSQDYLVERKAGYYPPKRRSRSRSRSGSPIAWHFQKQKKLDVTQSVDRVSPERFSKCFDDRKFTDKRESMIRYPERLKSDDHVRFGQQSGRFSSHKYSENGYNTRK